MKKGFIKKKRFTLVYHPKHPSCHAELVSASDKQKIPVSVETLSTHFFLFGSNAARKKKETGGAQRKKNVGLLPPGKSKICSLASLCSRSQRRLSAFTLAEVLITLSIIGVVAALTIPAIVRNYQKQQTVVQLKKVYSALANTTNLAIADNGPVTEWEIGEDSAGQAAVDFANRYLIPYLKVSKNCGIETTDACIFNYSYLNSNTQSSLNQAWARFYLNDGAIIGVKVRNNSAKYVVLYVDINGRRKPNKLGKDIFELDYYIYSGYVTPRDGRFMPNCWDWSRQSILSDSPGTCNKQREGSCCAGLIMKDGWQMKDDYPW